jgi:hypothetical protein
MDEDPKLSGSRRKKKVRKNNAKRMGLSEEINEFLERLWDIVQRSLRAG